MIYYLIKLYENILKKIFVLFIIKVILSIYREELIDFIFFRFFKNYWNEMPKEIENQKKMMIKTKPVKFLIVNNKYLIHN